MTRKIDRAIDPPERDELPTRVHFRLFPEDGGVIALFPDEIFDMHGHISSYMRVGQHGAADRDLISEFEPATPEQYASLKNELENVIGYLLEVMP